MYESLKNFIKEESINFLRSNYPTAQQLLNATEEELKQIPNIGGQSKVKLLKTFIDFNKELLSPPRDSYSVHSPKDVYNYLKIMAFYEEENFVGLYLNAQNRIIQSLTISKGTLDSAPIHPREFFSPAIRLKACHVIAVHNHPGGSLNPSASDINATKILLEASKILQIELLDHIIICQNGYASLSELGHM